MKPVHNARTLVLSGAAACAIGLGAGAAAAPKSVEIPFKVEVGERFVLDIESARERFKGAALQLKGSSKTTVDVEVLERLPAGYRYRWTFGKPTVTIEHPPEAVGNPIATRTAEIIAGTRFEFETDATGTPQRISNLGDVRDRLDRAVAAMVEEIVTMAQKNGAKEQDIEPIRKGLGSMSQFYRRLNEEQASALFLEEASLVNAAAGGSFSEQEQAVADQAVASSLGGAPFKVDTRTRLKEVSADGRRAVVEIAQRFDPEAVKQNITRLIPELAQMVGQSGKLPADLPAPDVRQTVVSTVDTATGVAERVQYEKVVSMGDLRMVQRKTMTQKRVP